MTPQEKAKELLDKYWIYLRAGLLYDEEAKEDAKQCALIAVDELIKQEKRYNNGTFYPSNYWSEVKQEIQNG
jgi:hypothetical protein